MNTKILIAAFAGLSLVAAAQSQSDKQKAQPSRQVSGNKTAQDDWTQRVAKPGSSNSGTKPSHVAVGDVNGDGRADVAVSSKNSAHATEAAASTGSSSNGQTPRDVASGQASGKRQHQPVTIMKSVDKATPRDAASGQASGKRQHQPVTIMKTTDKTSQ